MTTAESTLLAVHLASTAGMMGLIWFVQLVHYPLFAAVGPAHFADYESAHQKRTSWVVGPLMGVEGVSALLVTGLLRDEVGLVLPLVGLALLAVIHASTVFLQVPAHRQLANGYDADVQRHLVRTNWIRTIGWSLRVVVASAMVVTAG
jgi:hypothetical protein